MRLSYKKNHKTITNRTCLFSALNLSHSFSYPELCIHTFLFFFPLYIQCIARSAQNKSTAIMLNNVKRYFVMVHRIFQKASTIACLLAWPCVVFIFLICENTIMMMVFYVFASCVQKILIIWEVNFLALFWKRALRFSSVFFT